MNINLTLEQMLQLGGWVVAVVTLIATMQRDSKAHDSSVKDNARTIAHIEESITNLTKQVEKHNSIVERTYKLESDSSTAFRRIDELRGDLKDLREEVHGLSIGGTD